MSNHRTWRSGWLFILLAISHTACNKATHTPARIRQLRIQQPPKVPMLCTHVKKPAKHRLLLFASQWCDHCHTLMSRLKREPAFLKRWQLQPVLLWTDVKSCPKAKMAGNQYPDWPFGRPTAHEQQEWAVTATPVLYLLDQGQPILRIDGATTLPRLKRAIVEALHDKAKGTHERRKHNTPR